MTSCVDTSGAAPRVNFEQMQNFIGKQVLLVGKVESVQGNSLVVSAADQGKVTVLLRGAAPQEAYVEVLGSVESPNTLREECHTSFGSNFGEAPAPPRPPTRPRREECQRRPPAQRAAHMRPGAAAVGPRPLSPPPRRRHGQLQRALQTLKRPVQAHFHELTTLPPCLLL
jgi:replication factor A3